MTTPAAGTYPAYMQGYISLVKANNIKEAIETYAIAINDFFSKFPLNKIDYRYAENKWSPKEMLQHIIDTERIFGYRALTLARQDKTPLPGFDENNYATASNATARSWNDLLEEFTAVRKSTDFLLQSFTEEQLSQSSITNNSPNTTIAIAYAIFGHILHHINILRERYL